MNGFKNTSSITKFAVGMRINGNATKGEPWRNVVAVNEHGAYCLSDDKQDSSWMGAKCIDLCTLDLDSIWIGREYRIRGRQARNCIVRLVGDEMIGFEALDGAWNHVWSRQAFLDRYEPLPIDPPATPEPEKQPWRPEVGEKCLCNNPPEFMRQQPFECVPRCIGKTWTWVGHPGHESVDADTNGLVVETKSLSPLPPEPPVKVGECVEVQSGKYQTRGVVAYVSDDPKKHGFSVHDGYMENEFVWDQVTITRLAPVESKP